MIRLLIVRPAAEQDVAEARDWYEKRQPGLGDRFVSAVEQNYAQIEQAPELHAAEYRDVRRIKTDDFPYIIYYRVTVDRIDVLAVTHGSRHSRVWRSRL